MGLGFSDRRGLTRASAFLGKKGTQTSQAPIRIACLPIILGLESKSHGYLGVLGGPLGMYRVVGIHMAQGLELRDLGFRGLRHPDSFDKWNLRTLNYNK